MTADGHTVSLLHGADMKPEERDRVLGNYRNGKTKVLITTDVLARGIAILQIPMVINYDLPLTFHGEPDFETYLHRMGRSGVFSRSVIAINFVHDQTSKKQLQEIESFYRTEIKRLNMEDIPQLEQMLRKLN